jgi:hypothetical protein
MAAVLPELKQTGPKWKKKKTFLVGDSPASELYVPTFQNTICSRRCKQEE